MDKYDAIIIGTGIGGCGVGALLAHAGWKILILDKNEIFGGRCTTYERYGFKVDVGLHNFCLGDKGPLGDICRQVEMPNAIEWMSTVGSPTLRLGDEVIDYNRKIFINALPEEERENMGELLAKPFELSDQELDKLWYVSLRDWVDRFTKNRLAHTIIESLCCQYFCIPSSVASAAEWITCFKDLVTYRATAMAKGGNIAVPKAYISAIEKYGGEVRLKAKVKEVMIEGGAAVGIRLEDGSEFHSPVIISNADIKTTVNGLVGEEHFPKDYAQRIRDLTFSDHGLLFKVAFEEKIAEGGTMYIPDELSPTLKTTEEMRYGKIPKRVAGAFGFSTIKDPSMGPPGKQLFFHFCTSPPDQDWKQWKKTLLNQLYRLYPQAKDKILHAWLETPDFYNAWAGAEGSIIGVAQTVDQVHERRPSVTTPIKGLYLSSADVGRYHIGTELAASAAIALFEVLTR